MRIGVLGTGVVGRTLATKLVELGHEVTMGSRSAGNERAVEWAASAGDRAAEGTFADAAAHGELVFNCTAGTASLDALRGAGEEELRGKVLVDVGNALDFSKGMPPTLSIANDDSLGEAIQREFPDTRVVKSLNTVNASVMVEPVEGTNVFVCGDDEAAKSQVVELLESFGWPRDAVLDLGGIEASRGAEMYLPLWIRLMGVVGSPRFNIAVVR
jgi:predicted dinucleotide-binding enzyme